jgi:DNA-binding transcriptional LysR family regulator
VEIVFAVHGDSRQLSGMDLRQLRYFIAIAEERGFHKAARRLHVAQPALSACVKQLEDEIGHRLLERTRHHVTVTAAGHELLNGARRLVEAEKAAKDSVRSAAAGRGGPLRLGLIPPAMVPQFSKLVRIFQRSHPGVALSIQQGHLDDLIAAMHHGDLHAVIGRPEAATRLESIVPLATEEQGLAVPEGSPLADLPRIPIARLQGQRVLLLRENPHFGRLLQQACAEKKIAADFCPAGDQLSDLLWLVSAGLGCCPCSMLLREMLPPGARVRPLVPAPKLKLSLLIPKHNAAPTALAFVGIAREWTAGVAAKSAPS